eukprot:5169065-Pyramimonas_sp.AAC.1
MFAVPRGGPRAPLQPMAREGRNHRALATEAWAPVQHGVFAKRAGGPQCSKWNGRRASCLGRPLWRLKL